MLRAPLHLLLSGPQISVYLAKNEHFFQVFFFQVFSLFSTPWECKICLQAAYHQEGLTSEGEERPGEAEMGKVHALGLAGQPRP